MRRAPEAAPPPLSGVVLLTLRVGNGGGGRVGGGEGRRQLAHVGIGISGKEGAQAALASDFAIPQFRCAPGPSLICQAPGVGSQRR